MHQIAVILFALTLLLVGCAPSATSTIQAALSATPAAVKPARTIAVCQDGSVSYAVGQGACSWHGGVHARR